MSVSYETKAYYKTTTLTNQITFCVCARYFKNYFAEDKLIYNNEQTTKSICNYPRLQRNEISTRNGRKRFKTNLNRF